MTLSAKLLPAALAAGLIATTGALAQDAVKLETKYQEGTASTIKGVTKIQQVLNINGMDVETQQETEVTESRVVGQPKSDGALPVKEKVESLKAFLSAAGLTLTYDSTAGGAQEVDPQLQPAVDAYKALVGTEVTYVVKDGKITAVEGVEEALDKVRNNSPEAAEALKDQFNAEAVKKEQQEELSRIPSRPVKPGDTWTVKRELNLGSGQTMTFERTYEYQGTVKKGGKTLDKIGVTSTSVSLAMNNPIMKLSGSDLKIAASEGTILFDREAGAVVEESQRDQIVGPLTLTAGGMDLDAELDLTIEKTETVTPKSAKK